MSDVSGLKSMYESAAYAPETAAKLESYVETELRGSGAYCFETNKALMKYYQCFPEKSNEDLLLGTLMLALMHLPTADYLAMACIAPSTAYKGAGMLSVQALADQLDQGKFGAFWGSFTAFKGKAYTPKDFEIKVRAFILSSVQKTFATVDKAQLEGMLGMQGGDLDKMLTASPCVQDASGSKVAMQIIADNQKGTVKFDEGLSFEDVMKVLGNLAA
jgi:hypothetical protein